MERVTLAVTADGTRPVAARTGGQRGRISRLKSSRYLKLARGAVDAASSPPAHPRTRDLRARHRSPLTVRARRGDVRHRTASLLAVGKCPGPRHRLPRRLTPRRQAL